MDATAAADLLAFWFGQPGEPAYGQPRSAWFRKDDAFDAAIRARFPHRNAALGRPSTPEETSYLAQPGSGF